MFKRILSGYGKLFVSISKVLGLAALCAVFGCIIVLPLWKFAVSAPDAYSVTTLIIIAGFLLFFIVRKIYIYIHRGITDQAEKKKRMFRLLLTLLQIVVCVSGVLGIIVLILHEKKGIAGIVLAACVVIYGILAFGMRKDTQKQ